MITGYIVIGLFFLTAFIALLERYVGKYRLYLYIILGITLILTAGLREVGIDPDSANYEYTFINNDSQSSSITDNIEFSYLWISSILNFFTNDVHVLFLFYAFLGLTFKFIAFRRLTEFWFLPVVVYISYYFIIHEMMQIRTGVLSGLFLLAIHFQGEGKKLKALLLMLLGTLFHYSGLILLPVLFLSSDYMSLKKRFLWALAIPLSYIVFFLGINVIFTSDIPLVGAKLITYQTGEESGTGSGFVNVFRPLHLFAIALFSYLLYFYDTIVEKNKYFTLLLKTFIIGFCSYQILGFLPVLAQRVNMLYFSVTIPMYCCIYYTIRPKWPAILTVALVSFIYLNYGLPNISTTLFWSGK